MKTFFRRFLPIPVLSLLLPMLSTAETTSPEAYQKALGGAYQ